MIYEAKIYRQPRCHGDTSRSGACRDLGGAGGRPLVCRSLSAAMLVCRGAGVLCQVRPAPSS